MIRETEASQLEHSISKYLEWMVVTNHSSTTIEVRTKYMKYFCEWCAERSIEKLAEINRDLIERFQRTLYTYKKKNGKPLAAGSQYARLSALKMFFKYLVRQKVIEFSPASELQLPKLGKPLPKNIMSHEEVQSVMIQCDITNARGLRDRAIMELFYSNGIRRFELAALTMYDIDFDKGNLMIQKGKGNKGRVVPIGETSLKWLDKYLNESRPKLHHKVDEITLFLSHKGEPLTEAYLSKHIGKYIREAGINKSGACHLFRHSIATLMLDNGADIRYIQEMLGHESIRSTQVYTRVSIKSLKNVHEKTHPSNQKPEENEAEAM